MKLLVNGDLVDFEKPIFIRVERQEKFIAGLREIFADELSVKRITENKKELSDRTGKSKKFTEVDYIDLANPHLSNADVAAKQGKTSFAIQMKRGAYLKEIKAWAKKKGISHLSEEDVKAFLRDR